MILNLYAWIFPAAFFTAAGLSNLTPCVKGKRNPVRARSNRVVWFSLNISIAFCFMTGSVFFVNWANVVWSMAYLYFSLTVLIIFYLGFIFKYIIGLPIVFIITFLTLFFNIYLQGWKEVPDQGVISRYRILSIDQSGLKAEISGIEASPVILVGEGASLNLGFDVLEFDKMLFFIKSDIYYRLTDLKLEPDISESIIKFMVRNSFLLSWDTYEIDIKNKALLYEYSIVLNRDQKKIYIDN